MGDSTADQAPGAGNGREGAADDLPKVLAHDLRNMLQCATSAVRVTRRSLAGSGDWTLAATLGDALEAIERAGLLAHRLAQQSPPVPRLELVAVHEVVLSMRSLLKHLLGEAVRIDTLVSETIPPLRCDREELENAIMNMALNSREAMPDGGLLIIEARRCQQSGHSQECIALSVLDSGGGMPPEVAAQAFRPFFTTKGAAGGTGLGLSSVRGFAQRQGGTAEIRTSESGGTCVTLHLPIRTEEANP
jgi:signal transduction histidine kinase